MHKQQGSMFWVDTKNCALNFSVLARYKLV